MATQRMIPPEIDPVPSDSGAAAAATLQFRSQVGHISRQSGVFFAGTLFTAGLGYVFKVYLARVLGAEMLGLYALGMTMVGFFGIFIALGLAQSAVRYVAVYQASGRFRDLRALLWAGGGIQLFSGVIFAAIFMVATPFVARSFYHSPELVKYLPLFAAMMMVAVVSGFYGKVLAGYKDLSARTVIVSFIGVPLTMALSVAFITAGGALRGYLWGQIAAAVVVAVLLVAAVRRCTPMEAQLRIGMQARIPSEVWSFSATMMGVGLIEFLIVQVDKISLGYFRGAREVGVYSVAAALVAYVPLVLHSVNQIFTPTIADLHTRGEHALLARLFQSLTKWVVGLTLPLAAVIIMFAQPLMRIFGHDFAAGWPILVIGTVGQLVNCGVGSVGYLLLMSGHEKQVIRVQVLMAVLMIALCLFLVPLEGIIGAAIAAAVANIGMNVLNLLQVRRSLRISPYNRGYLRLILPMVVMVGVILPVRMHIPFLRHDWLAIAIASALAYLSFAGVTLMNGLDADDRLIGRAIWSRLQWMFGKPPMGLSA